MRVSRRARKPGPRSAHTVSTIPGAVPTHAAAVQVTRVRCAEDLESRDERQHRHGHRAEEDADDAGGERA